MESLEILGNPRKSMEILGLRSSELPPLGGAMGPAEPGTVQRRALRPSPGPYRDPGALVGAPGRERTIETMISGILGNS